MNVKDFIYNFFKRKGLSVFIASFIEKAAGFVLVLIVTNNISKGEFGFITYANTSLAFIIPFIGFGIHQGLMRYGSLSNSYLEKKSLFIITLKKGLKYSFVLMFLIMLLSPLITINLMDSRLYLLILSIQLISLFLLEILKIYARLINLNKLFSKITILNSLSLVVTTFVLSHNFGGVGYVLSLSFVPLFVALFFIFKLNLFEKTPTNIPDFNFKEFISYGLYSSLGVVISQLLFAVDVLLIGNLLSNSELLLAQYKVSNILPFNLMFLSTIFFTTDFVKLTNKSKSDKNYIKQYYINYLKIFSVVSLLIVVFFYLFSDYLILLFGDNYTNENKLMNIFSIGVVGALLFKVPLGNILSAVGWPKINALNSFIILLLNLVFSYIFIKKYGIIGAAIVTSTMIWLSGLLSLASFGWYLYKDKY